MTAAEIKTLTPLQQARVTKLIEAATQLFISQGYERTSLNQILKITGGSKQTIYSYFGDKEGLFKAVVDRLAENVFADLHLEHSNDWQNVLRSFAQSYFRHLASPEITNIFKMLMGEANARPELARYLLEHGPMETQRIFSEYLNYLNERGVLKIENVPLATDQFLASLRGYTHLKALCGDYPHIDESKQQADYAVQLFIKAHAVS